MTIINQLYPISHVKYIQNVYELLFGLICIHVVTQNCLYSPTPSHTLSSSSICIQNKHNYFKLFQTLVPVEEPPLPLLSPDVLPSSLFMASRLSQPKETCPSLSNYIQPPLFHPTSSCIVTTYVCSTPYTTQVHTPHIIP